MPHVRPCPAVFILLSGRRALGERQCPHVAAAAAVLWAREAVGCCGAMVEMLGRGVELRYTTDARWGGVFEMNSKPPNSTRGRGQLQAAPGLQSKISVLTCT